MPLLLFLILLFLILLSLPSLAQTLATNTTSCPLNFTILTKFISADPSSIPSDTPTRCAYALQGLHLLFADHLRTTSLFLPPPSSSSSCWSSYNSLISPLFPSSPFSLPSSCGFNPSWISQPGCMNISSRSAFESLVPPSALRDMSSSCNQSLADSPPCTACSTACSRVKASYLPGPDHGNVSDCAAYPFIYAGAFHLHSPADNDTALCLFLLPSSSSSPSKSHRSNAWIYGLAAGCFLLLISTLVASWS